MPDGTTDSRNAWVERVLGVRIGGAATGSETPAVAAPAQSGGVAGVTFTKARLAWDATRKQVAASLKTLEQTVVAECADEAFAAEVKANAGIVHTILDFLDMRLADKLDEALNAEAGPARKALCNEAREIINEYKDYMAADELTQIVDDNGFVEIGIIARMTTTLNAIDAQLKAA